MMRKYIWLILLTILCVPAGAQTIDNLGAAGALGGTESVPVFQGSNPAVKTTTQSIANLAVTSIATGCGASGGTITTAGAISTSETVNLQTGSNYAIVTGDCGKLVQLQNAGVQTPTIAQAGSAGFASGWFTDVVNTGAGTQTITPATSTINGAATYALAQNQGVRIVSDGTNYQVQPGKGPAGANPSATGSDVAVNGSAATFMRSDGAPAIQKGSNLQFGLAEGDNTSISLSAGVASLKALTGDCTTSAGAVAVSCVLKPTPPYYLTSNWYPPNYFGTEATGVAVVSGTVYCTYGGVNATVTIKALGIRVITGSAGNGQFAIYSSSGGTLTLVDSTASASVGSSASSVTQTVANTTDILSPGVRYAFCANFSSTPAVTSYLASSMVQGSIIGSATLANVVGGAQLSSRSIAQTFGTWPGTLTESGFADVIAAQGPIVAFQVN